MDIPNTAVNVKADIGEAGCVAELGVGIPLKFCSDVKFVLKYDCERYISKESPAMLSHSRNVVSGFHSD